MITRLLLLAMVPLSAHAADDFAQQWPLHLGEADAGAYRVPLNAQVYQAAYWRDLRDVRVLDADGKAVASAVYAAAAPLAGARRTQPLRWFVLPADKVSRQDDLSVVVQRDGTGNVVSVRNVAAASDAVDPVWLIDLGDDAGKLRRLYVDWTEASANVDLGYRVEGSDDLRDWQVVDPHVRVVYLVNDGNALSNNGVEVRSALRYLRLVPLQRQGAPTLQGIRGELAEPAVAMDWQWLSLEAAAGGNDRDGYLYTVQGRFPVQRLDVLMPANSAVSWLVSSRDEDRRRAGQDNAEWEVLTRGWNTWSVSEGGSQQRSAPLETTGIIGDRQWRLQAEPGAVPAQPPTFRLGYRPGSVVFLAQGKAPYQLVAGSAKGDIVPAALDPMLEALRARKGAQWQPASATLGDGRVRAGEAAYRVAAPPRDWKNVVLWGVLVAGALAVAGYAMSLMRSTCKIDTNPEPPAH